MKLAVPLFLYGVSHMTYRYLLPTEACVTYNDWHYTLGAIALISAFYLLFIYDRPKNTPPSSPVAPPETTDAAQPSTGPFVHLPTEAGAYIASLRDKVGVSYERGAYAFA